MPEPTRCQDVISIEKSGEHFRLLYDIKGRFTIHRITPEEATCMLFSNSGSNAKLTLSTDKLAKVKRVELGAKGVPYLVTHDGRTIRYPDPVIKVNDTVRLTLPTKITSEEKPKAVGVAPHGVAPSPKIDGHIKFEVGALVSITGGRNLGRVGTIISKERHLGGFDIVHVRDSLDREFSTRLSNVFVIGEHGKPWISLPKGKGVKLTITEGQLSCCLVIDLLTNFRKQSATKRGSKRRLHKPRLWGFAGQTVFGIMQSLPPFLGMTTSLSLFESIKPSLLLDERGPFRIRQVESRQCHAVYVLCGRWRPLLFYSDNL
jgi:ribosomal protein S4E